MPDGRQRRKRNPRGQGARLRDEIIEATTAILERTGSEYALSLRGIAREVGIAAPSISAHFADMYEILDAVIARETTVLFEAMVASLEAAPPDPVERLLAVCRGYVRYGSERPGRYQMLVHRRWLAGWEQRHYASPETDAVRAAALELATEALRECVAGGRSTSTGPSYDTLVLWCSLDGLISLRAAMAGIEWPDEEQMLIDCVRRCAGITEVPPAGAGPGPETAGLRRRAHPGRAQR